MRCCHCGEDDENDRHKAMGGWCPDSEVFVRCDDACRAKVDPQTPEEVRLAYEHWRGHYNMRGCSHGR